jgi:hypothetical protein
MKAVLREWDSFKKVIARPFSLYGKLSLRRMLLISRCFRYD